MQIPMYICAMFNSVVSGKGHFRDPALLQTVTPQDQYPE